ncbi:MULTISPECIES: UbiX family flavin prenyltransferase [Aromatoleum]|uniref:Flavin prenyltransferase UbiX n=1 Tax=Aromatoleum evansii TaxID=59406 RepID=A0ABZ1APW8_AROEV|nr:MULTISPECIES: UbiX family flavin prenyltransferase [Aromatoleum]NMG27908.1 UbiX family flavin prenyltransferase [Aromatoleum evansii]WRL47909.1 UbiX family flavin prenyltransferase [Aromatoleum evansii]
MRIVVGISGASGAIYGIRILEALKQIGVETDLVMSDSAKRTIVYETDYSINDVKRLASCVHDNNDVGASIASGSFKHAGMIIAPCSIKTLSAVANCFNTNLLIRAADVTLKERRKLVLMLRETPLHLGHLRLMTQATETGAVLVPPLPAFYHRPKTIDDIINQSVTKVLDQFDLDVDLFGRWTGNEERELAKSR